MLIKFYIVEIAKRGHMDVMESRLHRVENFLFTLPCKIFTFLDLIPYSITIAISLQHSDYSLELDAFEFFYTPNNSEK